MLKQEQVDELRIAMYEDVNVLYDFFTDKWSDEALEEAQEAVPGITREELDEYRKQDQKYMAAVVKLASRVGRDPSLMDDLFEKKPEEAYELVKGITGDDIPYEDFVDILEYGGKPFFKCFEGATMEDDELGEDDLEEVAGGGDEEKAEGEAAKKILEKILEQIAKCFTAESPVDTPEGLRSIKDIKEGDKVYSLDKEGNRLEAKVTGITRGEGTVIDVHFANGKVWHTTSTQWFYDGRRFHDVWQHNGRDVVTLEGEATKITDIVETGRKETVYDLILDGTDIMFIDGTAAEGFVTLD